MRRWIIGAGVWQVLAEGAAAGAVLAADSQTAPVLVETCEGPIPVFGDRAVIEREPVIVEHEHIIVNHTPEIHHR